MKVLTTLTATVLLLAGCHGAIGPIRPELHPSTRLQEAIRKMRLTLDHELIYIARAEANVPHLRGNENLEAVDRQESSPEQDDGFTDEVNTGEETFEPLRPGASVPPANEFETPVPTDLPVPSGNPTVTPEVPATTPPPTEPTTSELPRESDSPIVTPIGTPIPFPVGPTPDAGGPPDVTPIATTIPFEPPVEATLSPTETPTPIPVTEAPTPMLTTPFPTEDAPVATATPTGAFPPILDPDEPEPSVSESSEPGVSGSSEPTPEETDEDSDSNIETSTGTPSPESEDDDDDDVCFPSTATVELEDGSIKKMVDVQLGDRVRVGPNSFSEVFMFTHKLANIRYSFVSLTTESGHNVKLTKGHYLYVNGALAAAESVKEGDYLSLSDSTVSTVSSVEKVMSTGLFNPQTVHGDIVVDGVRATTYTTSVEMSVAHSLLAPLRALYVSIGWSLSAFSNGGGKLTSLVPSGSDVL